MSSTSAYELVPPPAPKTVARPTTLGACHVRLQLSMLCVPKTTRASFCAAKFTSFVDFEQEKMPVEFGPRAAMFRRNPSAAASRATSHDTGVRTPFSRTIGCVIRAYSRLVRLRLRVVPDSKLSALYIDVECNHREIAIRAEILQGKKRETSGRLGPGGTGREAKVSALAWVTSDKNKRINQTRPSDLVDSPVIA